MTTTWLDHNVLPVRWHQIFFTALWRGKRAREPPGSGLIPVNHGHLQPQKLLAHFGSHRKFEHRVPILRLCNNAFVTTTSQRQSFVLCTGMFKGVMTPMTSNSSDPWLGATRRKTNIPISRSPSKVKQVKPSVLGIVDTQQQLREELPQIENRLFEDLPRNIN
ncbi:hypothetical protein EVAR_20339_1 [Eumeta japonica]|uniref:Uncharacterized protein n=1 Tax=Eumeta variegata TaxID=151549 RepID=A0A4C1VS63_EUMVA|nr:hypothetical protein EVAR_20339_1 [Eumeta japonica]